MTNLTNFNASRRARTEARITEVRRRVQEREQSRAELITHFTKQWGVSKRTVEDILQYMKRKGILKHVYMEVA